MKPWQVLPVFRVHAARRMSGRILVAALLALPACSGDSSSGDDPGTDEPLRVTFTDATLEAGLTYRQCGTDCDRDRTTGGAAVADVDGDGHLDLFVTRYDDHDLLFRNRGDGTFEDVSVEAGFADFDLRSNGAGFGDVDNDGDPDLYVTVLGRAFDPVNNRYFLFINDGTGRFTEEAPERAAATPGVGERGGQSVAFGDFDRDGDLDIHTTSWVFPFGGADQARLLRNRGPEEPGHFEDVTDEAGVRLGRVFGYGSTFVDLDADGWPDLAVAADFGTSRLYWNNRDGTFSDGTSAAAVGTDENGMGSTFGDVDGDGDLDWFVTSIHDPDRTCDRVPCKWGHTGNRLYRNLGERRFADATDALGVREGYWGWGAAFLDFDNDGDLDLTMTNGIDAQSDLTRLFEDDPMRFWVNDGAEPFIESSEALGVTDRSSGKGLVVFDYDDDGDLDLFVVNHGSSPTLFRNENGNARDWIRVRVVGDRSNRDGVGAIVRVAPTDGSEPAQVREMGVATHFLGHSENRAHFGVGSSGGPVQVEVRFPATGEIRTCAVPAPRVTLTVHEGANGPEACVIDAR